MVGLIVFGGQDPVTNLVLEYRAAWEKIRVAWIAKLCLKDKKVCKLVDDRKDEYDHLVKIIQEANNKSTHTLIDC